MQAGISTAGLGTAPVAAIAAQPSRLPAACAASKREQGAARTWLMVGCTQPVRMAWMVAIASMPPAAPRQCPIMLLVAFILTCDRSEKTCGRGQRTVGCGKRAGWTSERAAVQGAGRPGGSTAGEAARPRVHPTLSHGPCPCPPRPPS